MEEEVDKEAEKEELSKALAEAEAKLSETNGTVEQLRAQNRLSFTSSSKEIQNLEKRRQELIKELQRVSYKFACMHDDFHFSLVQVWLGIVLT